MKKAGTIFLLGLLMLIVQEILRYYTAGWSSAAPNLIIILVLFLAYHEHTVVGALLSFLLGVQYDLAAGTGVIGPWAGSFVAVFGIFTALSQRIFSETGPSLAIAASLATSLAALIYHLLHFKVSTQLPASPRTIIIEACITGLLTPLLFPRIKQSMGMRRRSRHW